MSVPPDENSSETEAQTSPSGRFAGTLQHAPKAARDVCPCRNRTFQNPQRHMESQHPEFEKLK
jgi:hypothetical protein